MDNWPSFETPKHKEERLMSSSMGDLNEIFSTMSVQKVIISKRLRIVSGTTLTKKAKKLECLLQV